MSFMNSGKGALSLLITVLILIFAFSILLSAGDTASVRDKKVLIIHSYHQGLAWTHGQDEGIREILASKPNIEISTEYLDTKRIALEKISDFFAKFIAEKYSSTSFEAIIVTDNNALTFVSENYSTLFPGTPVVFSGINNYRPVMLNEFGGLATGVVQTLDPKGTFDLIMKLQPHLQSLVVVSGATPTAHAIRDKVKTELGEMRQPPIVWLDDLATDDLLEKLGALTNHDAVLLCNFNRDGAGNYYSHDKSGRMISEASNAPVYAMEDHYLGTGVTGGYMNCSNDQGIAAGTLCLEILETGNIPEVNMTSPNAIMFDYNAMSRFGLDVSMMPRSAIIIDLPPTFYADHKLLIWNTVIVFCLLLFSLFGISIGLAHTRRAKKKLRRSEERLDLALSVNNNGIFDWDIPANKVYFDSRYYTMAGYEPNEFPGVYDEWTNRVHPEDIEKVEQDLNAYLIGETTKYDVEFRFKRKDNEWMWIRARVKVVERDEKNRPLRMVGTHTDITERKQAEEALRDSELRFRDFFDNAPIGFHIIDSNRVITDVNDSELEMIGYTRDEIIGKKAWADLIVPEQKEQFEKHWQDIVTKGNVRDLEYTFVHKQGHHINVILNASSRFDDDGKLINTRGSILDITDRKEAENELKKSRNFLQKIIDGIPDEVIVIDSDYHVLLANQAVLEITGNSDFIAKGMPCYQILHHRDSPCQGGEHLCPLREVLRTGKPATTVHTHKDATGNKVFMEISASPIFNDSGDILHIVESSRNITERKLAQEALKASEDKFSKAFNLNPSSMGISDLENLQRIEVNEAFVQISGYSREELLSNTAGKLGEFSSDQISQFIKLLKRDGSVHDFEATLHTKTGQEKLMLYSGEAFEIDGKEHSIVAGLDITERKRAEEALRESEKLNRAIFDQAPVGIAVIDSVSGGFIQVNDAYCDITGYSYEEMLSLNYLQ